MAVSKSRWKKAGNEEKKLILKIYYPDLYEQIRQEAMGKRIKRTTFFEATTDKSRKGKVKSFVDKMKNRQIH